MTCDLLIKGGTLVDPAQKVHARKDVAFSGGVVAAVGDDLSGAEAREVVDARGCLVTPGMIDLHVHVFYGVSHFGVAPDPTCLARGATTVVDAGSAGADTFPGFRKYVIDVSATRILAQLNISSQGMLTREIGEFEIPEYADVGRACQMIERHRDIILGVKVRLTRHSIVSERSGMLPLHRAREAADAAGLPIMVHPQNAWCESLDDILGVMRERDILTHCFHGMACGILDERGQVRRSAREAMERGVVFDVGHGAGSFNWEVVERAMAQGVQPQTISSDLHVYNLHGPVYDLATVVTKFLHLGMPLDEAMAKVTAVPARVIRMQDRIGTLAVGAWGDAVVFELRDGEFQLVDAHGGVRTGRQRLVPVAVVKGGRVYRQGLKIKD
ncbi:MAG: dihydroorotase [Candidatus Handelsmanbacteria bacterium RIFCSPLOWO2_12_FULL_64_10]|uniref:Dihydroorotase n=1 Tax=Handelsmanbacteria sp. (strain RIFCSPLOWO2_12_FULL_64_10) TaxID=1817868 RepID=A0A1F6CCF8_HANXR|nr:MAG: dihydroorotase [Candidatus Handelsmanbacteria bacterium RIFCSPLOWO2_12_FULL_64_10]